MCIRDSYEADGNDYSYVYNWMSDFDVDQITVVVQQPLAAVDFRIDPPASGTAAERGDSLTYHTLPPRSVAAGEPFTVTVNYTVEAPVLSAPTTSGTTGVSDATTAPPVAAAGNFNPLWLLAGAGALALIGGAWVMGWAPGHGAGPPRKTPHPLPPPQVPKHHPPPSPLCPALHESHPHANTLATTA